MKLFDKRPLSLILCIMLTVFVIFSNLSFEYTIIAAACSFLLFIFSFILPKIFRAKLYAVRIAALLIIPTIMFSNVYFNRYFRADLRFFDEEVTLNGYVYEIDKAASTETDVAIIKTTDINGEPFSAYSLIAYFSKEESEEMTVGAKLTLTGRLSGFSGNSTTQYGYGHSAVITDISSLRVSGYAEPRLSNILSDYRNK